MKVTLLTRRWESTCVTITRSLVGLASSYDNFMNLSNDVSWDMCRILGLEIGGARISSACDCHFEYYLNRLGAGNQPQLLGWVARLARWAHLGVRCGYGASDTWFVESPCRSIHRYMSSLQEHRLTSWWRQLWLLWVCRMGMLQCCYRYWVAAWSVRKSMVVSWAHWRKKACWGHFVYLGCLQAVFLFCEPNIDVASIAGTNRAGSL